MTDWSTAIATGLFNGFGSAVGAYLATQYALKHLESARKKADKHYIIQGIKKEIKKVLP